MFIIRDDNNPIIMNDWNDIKQNSYSQEIANNSNTY